MKLPPKFMVNKTFPEMQIKYIGLEYTNIEWPPQITLMQKFVTFKFGRQRSRQTDRQTDELAERLPA